MKSIQNILPISYAQIPLHTQAITWALGKTEITCVQEYIGDTF